MGTRAADGASQYTQASRPLAIYTILEPDQLLLVGFEGEEAVSHPYLYTLHLVSPDPALDPAQLVRSKAMLRMEAPGGEVRLVHGRLASFVQLESDDDLTAYRAELVPPFWFLSLSRDSRVFVDLHVNEIVETLLTEAGLASGTDFEISLMRTPPKLRWSVQYRESPLDYISRLLEEAGIFYYFVHGDDGVKMVITDANATAEYPPGTKPVRMAPVGGTATLELDTVAQLRREMRARPGKITLADYNFRTPSSHLLTTLEGEHREEVYDYPARFRDMQHGDQMARLRLEEQEALNVVVRGSGPVRTIRAGGRFDLVDHYHEEFNVTYLALSVSLTARITGLRSNEDTTFSFGAELTAIPFDVPYRPARSTPTPTVAGVQTAVVGPAPGGEEIMVDKYGRIPIQYHWDRRNKEENKPSCWARVAQPWAGKSWGSVSIPRIGQEVVVEFLEGDPDRPLVTGSVYNAEQMPPYGLPSNGMVSGFKSNSTPGGGGYNEISANDTKGKELITIHAQYDMSTTVEHDDTQHVKNDRTITVDGTHTETITKDTTIRVTEGKYVHRVETGTADVYVKAKLTEEYADSQETKVAKTVTINAGDEITIITGDSSINMKKDGTITIAGKKITIVADDEAKMSAKKSEMTATQEAKMGVGNQSVTANVQKLATAGAQISHSAVGIQEITGALVKIN